MDYSDNDEYKSGVEYISETNGQGLSSFNSINGFKNYENFRSIDNNHLNGYNSINENFEYQRNGVSTIANVFDF